MKNLHCFSGNGNSAAVAAELERLLPADFADHVWVMPVYAWGVPPVLVRHISGLDLSGSVHHMVCTYGDEAGNIHLQWQRLIAERGGTVGGIFSVQMPNTYVCLPFFNIDSPELQCRKLHVATERVAHIAERLAAGSREVDIYRGPLPGFKSKVIYPWFFNHLMRAAKFHACRQCVGCGICAKQCPRTNITMLPDGTPAWGTDCAFCLRCYHGCPQHAVAYGRQTQKKGQYLHPDFQKVTKLCGK
jgi:ferredoxin